MTHLLSIAGLRCGYGAREVLAGVDLAVRAGEFVGLLGPNGSGKTTLLRAVTRVIRPAAGTIRIGGDPAETLAAREIARRVAVVPQDMPAALPFTAAEVVEMGRYPHARRGGDGPADEAAVREAMARTGVLEFRRRTPDALSAGERQRVMLARALAQAAPLLLVDEPTAHMDLRYQIGMLELLRSLTGSWTLDTGPRTPLGVLAVLHDLNLALRFCTRVALLSGGRIVADGAPEDILTRQRILDVFGVDVDAVRPEVHERG